MARQALTDLETQYAEQKLRLEADLPQIVEAAEPIRYGLLYGTCDELVAAVAKVLTAAGLTTVDLDEALGDTKSADLLVSGCAAASGRGKGRQRPSPRVARWIPAASPRHVASAALRPTGEWRRSSR